MGSAGLAKALPDNGVPGPGTYQLPQSYPETESSTFKTGSAYPIPSFKIMKATQLNEKQEMLKKQEAEKSTVGPQTYNP
jgi:hypothetical protein